MINVRFSSEGKPQDAKIELWVEANEEWIDISKSVTGFAIEKGTDEPDKITLHLIGWVTLGDEENEFPKHD